MSPDSARWERARELFDAARAQPVDRRAAFLHDTCPDHALRAEVAALLQAHEALGSGAWRDFLTRLDAGRTAALLAPNSPEFDPDAIAPDTYLGRYRIVRRLADGGMGVVHLAHDPRLDRPVALKLLPRHLSVEAGARMRFEEEARTASALDHPHIVTVYEIGDAPDGRLFIVMAYCEGETLRQELERAPMPIPRALTLAAQIADGLAATHERGIVHRDIKPGNVLVTPDGMAKIVDFGIAKMAGRGTTQPGSTPGTLAYMSPEQTRGQAADPRTDIWAFGATLYEMLTAERAFPGDSEPSVVHAIRHDQPAPIRRLRPDAPSGLVRLVERCLDKDPARRYADGRALLAELRHLESGTGPVAPTRRRASLRYVSAFALLALLIAGSVALGRHLAGMRPAAPVPGIGATVFARLAVLPLANDSPDPDDAYLAEAMTRELIARLSVLQNLRVTARTSVLRYRDRDERIGDLADTLGVGAVLTGRVRTTATGVWMTLRLMDARSERPLWARDYASSFEDIMAVQRAIAEQVAAVLQVRISTDEQHRLAERGTQEPQAYVAYLRGHYLLGNLDAESFRAAQRHFLDAQRLDPTFARAWSGLADAYQYLASLSVLAEAESYPRARAAAERALSLEPGLAEAHASLAMTLSMYYRNGEAAERHFREAIALDPSYARAYQLYAAHLRNLSRTDEALAAARTAQELDPLSAFPRLEEAIILYVSRDFDAAIERSARLLDAHPNALLARLLIALAYAQTERYADALAALDEADPRRQQPDALAVRGYVLARTRRHPEARQVLGVLEALPMKQSGFSFQKAVVHVGLGDIERALELLARAADERSALIRLIGVDPLMDPLRADPRFRALVERVLGAKPAT